MVKALGAIFNIQFNINIQWEDKANNFERFSLVLDKLTDNWDTA